MKQVYKVETPQLERIPYNQLTAGNKTVIVFVRHLG